MDREQKGGPSRSIFLPVFLSQLIAKIFLMMLLLLLLAVLLEGKQLLGAEGLVVDQRGRLDQILQVGACQEVAQVNELAVVLILDYFLERMEARQRGQFTNSTLTDAGRITRSE